MAGRSRAMSRHRLRLAAAVLLGLAGCTSGPPRAHAPARGYCVSGHGCYRVLASGAGYEASGIASWYGRGDAGKPTASGAPFDPNAMRIAHKTLPFGTWVRIRNLRNGREAVAMVDDRGPFHGGRVIDTTAAVAERLGFYGEGTARVQVTDVPVTELSAAQREAARADETEAMIANAAQKTTARPRHALSRLGMRCPSTGADNRKAEFSCSGHHQQGREIG